MAVFLLFGMMYIKDVRYFGQKEGGFFGDGFLLHHFRLA